MTKSAENSENCDAWQQLWRRQYTTQPNGPWTAKNMQETQEIDMSEPIVGPSLCQSFPGLNFAKFNPIGQSRRGKPG